MPSAAPRSVAPAEEKIAGAGQGAHPRAVQTRCLLQASSVHPTQHRALASTSHRGMLPPPSWLPRSNTLALIAGIVAPTTGATSTATTTQATVQGASAGQQQQLLKPHQSRLQFPHQPTRTPCVWVE